MQNYFSHQLTPEALKESKHSSQMKKPTTFFQEPTSKQVVQKQLFWMKCPVIKVHLTPKYFFCLNKSLHLFEAHCVFLN